MLRGADDRGVASVEVHLEGQRDVAADNGALEEMHMLHGINRAGDVVEILDRRLAIVTACRIHHVDGSSGGAEVYLLSPRLHVVARVLTAEDEVPGSPRDRVLDKRPRECQATVPLQDGASFSQQFNPARRRVGQSDLFQNIEGRTVNARNIALAQRQVSSAIHAGPDRAQVRWKSRRSCSSAGLATQPAYGGHV